VTLGQANELRFTGAAGSNSTQIFCVRSADLSQAASIVFDFADNFTAPIVINIQVRYISSFFFFAPLPLRFVLRSSFFVLISFLINSSLFVLCCSQGSPNETTASFRSAAIQRSRLRSEQLLWNVCDSLDVTLSQFQLFGSLLAPNSSLTISNAEQVRAGLSHFGLHEAETEFPPQQEGITVVSTLSGQGFQKRLAPFNGFFCQSL
jgi:hypothetical protein